MPWYKSGECFYAACGVLSSLGLVSSGPEVFEEFQYTSIVSQSYGLVLDLIESRKKE